MGKIAIICLNSAVDQIIVVDEWKEGKVMRSTEMSTWTSGKGFNSARALSEIDDLAVHLIAVVGLQSQDFFDLPIGKNSKTFLLTVPGHSRTNVTVGDSSGKLIAHLQTQGAMQLPQNLLAKVLQKTKEVAYDADVIILSGSLPEGLSKNTYQLLIHEMKMLGKIVLFDSSGDELLEGLTATPFLIKPNLEEFASLLGREISSVKISSIGKDLRELKSTGVPYIALTLGKDGLLFFDTKSDKLFHGNLVLKSTHHTLNEIGCGDSFMGGFAYGLIKTHSAIEAAKYGIRYGAANLFASGPGNIDVRFTENENIALEWKEV